MSLLLSELYKADIFVGLSSVYPYGFFQLVALMLGSISSVPNLLGTQSRCCCCIADVGLLLLRMLNFPSRCIH